MSHNENEYIRGFFGLKKVNITALNNKDEHNSINDSWRASTGKPGLRGAQPEKDTVISVTFYLLIDTIVTIINQTDSNKTIRFVHCDTPKAESRSVLGPKYPTAKYADRENNQTYFIFDKIKRFLHIQIDGQYDTDIPVVYLKKVDDPAKKVDLKRQGLLFIADEYLSDGDYELIMEIQRTQGKKTLREIYGQEELRREAPSFGMRAKR